MLLLLLLLLLCGSGGCCKTANAGVAALYIVSRGVEVVEVVAALDVDVSALVGV